MARTRRRLRPDPRDPAAAIEEYLTRYLSGFSTTEVVKLLDWPLPLVCADCNSRAEAEAEAGTRVFGDAAYGAGELLKCLDDNRIHNGVKVQSSPAVKDPFSKDRFGIDLDAMSVTCPAEETVPIRPRAGIRVAGAASFGAACIR